VVSDAGSIAVAARTAGAAVEVELVVEEDEEERGAKVAARTVRDRMAVCVRC